VRVHELSPAECEEVLGRASVGRLGCVKDQRPYIVPIHIAFDGRDVFGFSTVGQKIEWLRANPRACVQVDEIVDSKTWTTVLAEGRYEEVSPDDREMLVRAEALLSRRPSFWLPAAAKVSSHESGQPVVYRIVVDRLTGRRAKQ
jgi:nitroimidazol reductase NimA-like FMN-containing flavoprotein (pyridoxamine 5'-phosphate oxidase superfamily)